MKLDVFIDINNLYFSLRDMHDAKVNYPALLERITELGEIQHCEAYGSKKSFNHNFALMLKRCGIEAVFEGNYNKSTVLSISMLKSNADIIVLCSNNDALIPVIKEVPQRVILFACNISKRLEKVAYQSFQISEDLWIRKPCSPATLSG